MNTTAARQLDGLVYLAARKARDYTLPNTPIHHKLTAREIQVLKLIGLGYSINEIADNLYLSTHTIVSYCNSLKQKLQCKKATQLAVMAERLGLLNGLSFHL